MLFNWLTTEDVHQTTVQLSVDQQIRKIRVYSENWWVWSLLQIVLRTCLEHSLEKDNRTQLVEGSKFPTLNWKTEERTFVYYRSARVLTTDYFQTAECQKYIETRSWFYAYQLQLFTLIAMICIPPPHKKRKTSPMNGVCYLINVNWNVQNCKRPSIFTGLWRFYNLYKPMWCLCFARNNITSPRKDGDRDYLRYVKGF